MNIVKFLRAIFLQNKAATSADKKTLENDKLNLKSSRTEIKLFWKFTKKQPRNFQEQPFKQLLWNRLKEVVFGHLSFRGRFEVFSFCIFPNFPAVIKNLRIQFTLKQFHQ